MSYRIGFRQDENEGFRPVPKKTKSTTETERKPGKAKTCKPEKVILWELFKGQPIIPSANPNYRLWTKHEDRLLGRYSDEEVAKRLSRSGSSVHHRRIKLGIDLPNPKVRRWSQADDVLLGTMRDEELAQKLNRPKMGVMLPWQQMRIPIFFPLRKK